MQGVFYFGFLVREGDCTCPTCKKGCTCMYVCMYVCMLLVHTCMYVCLYVCYLCTHVCMYVCMSVCHVCTHRPLYRQQRRPLQNGVGVVWACPIEYLTCLSVSLSLSLSLSVCVCVCVCVCRPLKSGVVIVYQLFVLVTLNTDHPPSHSHPTP